MFKEINNHFSNNKYRGNNHQSKFIHGLGELGLACRLVLGGLGLACGLVWRELGLGRNVGFLRRLLQQHFQSKHQRCGRLQFGFCRLEEVHGIVQKLSIHHAFRFGRS